MIIYISRTNTAKKSGAICAAQVPIQCGERGFANRLAPRGRRRSGASQLYRIVPSGGERTIPSSHRFHLHSDQGRDFPSTTQTYQTAVSNAMTLRCGEAFVLHFRIVHRNRGFRDGVCCMCVQRFIESACRERHTVELAFGTNEPSSKMREKLPYQSLQAGKVSRAPRGLWTS
jgi:hypothetical protein